MMLISIRKREMIQPDFSYALRQFFGEFVGGDQPLYFIRLFTL